MWTKGGSDNLLLLTNVNMDITIVTIFHKETFPGKYPILTFRESLNNAKTTNSEALFQGTIEPLDINLKLSGRYIGEGGM